MADRTFPQPALAGVARETCARFVEGMVKIMEKEVKSGQYVERETPARQESDMVNEAARELVGLPKYTAFANVIEERGGEQKVWKGKIRTIRI